MAHKKSLEALDRILKDLRSNHNRFGGAMILLAGDFRQTLPVIVINQNLITITKIGTWCTSERSFICRKKRERARRPMAQLYEAQIVLVWRTRRGDVTGSRLIYPPTHSDDSLKECSSGTTGSKFEQHYKLLEIHYNYFIYYIFLTKLSILIWLFSAAKSFKSLRSNFFLETRK